MKQIYHCDYCGEQFERLECRTAGKKHLFCSRQCLADFSNKTKNPNGYEKLKDYTGQSINMTAINKKLNPTRMTPQTREKLRNIHLDTGGGKTAYTKIFSRAAHRVIAEQALGRELVEGEVVHHIDGNSRNNHPENLRVFATNSEHARFHHELRAVLSMLDG